MAYVTTISRHDAQGELAAVYAELAARPMPDVYQPDDGDAAGIIKAHSLDPVLMAKVFGASGDNHASELSWEQRELISAATSRANDCFY